MDEKAIREEAIRRYENGESPKNIYEAINRSKSWFYKWLKRYQNEEADWAADRSKRPHNIPKRIGRSMEKAVIETRKHLMVRKYAQIGALNIRWVLEEKGIKPPSLSTINRVIKRNNLVYKKQKKYQPKGTDYPALPITRSNQVHQLDILGPRYLKTDGRFYSANIIDAFDRRTSINPSRGKTRKDITNALIRCWRTLGLPMYLQMDNILPTRGSNRYPHSFGLVVRLCLKLGVQPVFIPLNEPWRNGIIERFQNVFDKMFFRSQLFDSFDHLIKESKVFESFHNHNHRYSTLHGKTPLEIYSGDGDLLPENFRIPVKLSITPGYVHLIRFIRSDRILDVFGEKFLLPMEYEYAWATIDTEKEILNVYQDAKVIKTYKYRIPKTSLDILNLDM